MNSPLDSSKMLRLRGQLGSNPAGLYQAGNAERYYIKTLESVQHANNEWIAAQLYKLLGAPTLEYLKTTEAEQIATRWLDLDKKSLAQFTNSERAQAQQWFAVHAWMANWDAVGFHGDNQGVFAGKVLSLDLGGALAFRAMGDPKGRAFSTKVEELSRLRSDADNPQAQALFSAMSKEQLIASIERVTQLSETQIQQVILDNGGHQKLADKMLGRKADMAQQLRELL